MKRFAALVALLFTLTCFAGNAFAATKEQKVTITRPVMVGTTQLNPGDYSMTWSGDSGVVQITFLQNKKVIATSSARIAAEPNASEQVETTLRNGAKMLQVVRTKNATFYVDLGPASGN